MIELKRDELVFQFPDVHADAVCRVGFQRTLRIPDDNREYPLPPGLGRFPLEQVDDHASRLPAAWAEHGGVLLPMYQSEALWINFSSFGNEYPFAIKIAAGKINAVTGDTWTNDLANDPQDYLVAPDQRWLDGFCVQKGLIRQFVAMPLGQGYTAEEQLSGAAEHGGLQIIVYPMKRDCYEKMKSDSLSLLNSFDIETPCFLRSSAMGLAPGGLMRQEIYEDEYGFDVWDTTQSSRCFVHILNSEQWTASTGKPVPGQPPSAKNYTAAGLPWFEYYDDKLCALNGAEKLAGMDSVAAKGVKLGEKPLAENDAVNPQKIVPLGSAFKKINEGNW